MATKKLTGAEQLKRDKETYDARFPQGGGSGLGLNPLKDAVDISGQIGTDIEGANNDIGSAIEKLFTPGEGFGRLKGTPVVVADPKTAKLPSPADAAKGEPTTTESPYETLANSLAQQYITQTNALEPLIAGQSLGTAVNPAAQLSTALAGTGASVPASATKVEGEVDPTAGGLNTTLGQTANTAALGDINMAQAIADTGKANTETLEAAPWQQLLSELASETAYKAATQGASAFGLTQQNTPAFLAPILQNLGLSATASDGLTAPGTKTATTPAKAASGTANTNPGTEPSNPSNPAS